MVEAHLDEFRRGGRIVDRDTGSGAEGQHRAVQKVPETGLYQLPTIGFVIDVGDR